MRQHDTFGLSSGGDAEAGESRVQVGGVQWLGGAPPPERTRRDDARAASGNFVIGRAHGPRLLELCRAG